MSLAIISFNLLTYSTIFIVNLLIWRTSRQNLMPDQQQSREISRQVGQALLVQALLPLALTLGAHASGCYDNFRRWQRRRMADGSIFPVLGRTGQPRGHHPHCQPISARGLQDHWQKVHFCRYQCPAIAARKSTFPHNCLINVIHPAVCCL
jgi:hypothetical protein